MYSTASSKYGSRLKISPLLFTIIEAPSKISSVFAPVWLTDITGILYLMALDLKIFSFASILVYENGEADIFIMRSGFCFAELFHWRDGVQPCLFKFVVERLFVPEIFTNCDGKS